MGRIEDEKLHLAISGSLYYEFTMIWRFHVLILATEPYLITMITEIDLKLTPYPIISYLENTTEIANAQQFNLE